MATARLRLLMELSVDFMKVCTGRLRKGIASTRDIQCAASSTKPHMEQYIEASKEQFAKNGRQ